ncbi:MAG: aminotransferase class V-fold PLP-dependent enzyme [Pirellula sp.]
MPAKHSTAVAIQQALAEISDSGAWRTYHGSNLDSLRSSLAKYFGREHVRLCCSGTFGVELALRSLMLEPGSEVLLAGYDFPGNFRSILDAGLAVSVCDVMPGEWVVGVEQLSAAITSQTRALVVSHLHGTMAPMESICEWARAHQLLVVEDACQEPGAMATRSEHCRKGGGWGDISVLSFGGSKLLSAGRGGAVMTNDARLAQRMTIYCERGNDAYALSELQAAVLLPQLAHLNDDNARRWLAAKQLQDELNGISWLQTSIDPESEQMACYKFGMRVNSSLLEFARVQKFVLANSTGEDDAMVVAREYVLKRCEANGLATGAGFNGFARRHSGRCRMAPNLENSLSAAQSTIVLHHSHLLAPATGECSIDLAVQTIQRIDRELRA